MFGLAAPLQLQPGPPQEEPSRSRSLVLLSVKLRGGLKLNANLRRP